MTNHLHKITMTTTITITTTTTIIMVDHHHLVDMDNSNSFIIPVEIHKVLDIPMNFNPNMVITRLIMVAMVKVHKMACIRVPKKLHLVQHRHIILLDLGMSNQQLLIMEYILRMHLPLHRMRIQVAVVVLRNHHLLHKIITRGILQHRSSSNNIRKGILHLHKITIKDTHPLHRDNLHLLHQIRTHSFKITREHGCVDIVVMFTLSTGIQDRIGRLPTILHHPRTFWINT
mmetsp:Transcript_19956/g.28266  ORF Transcript_19956/g.28266 Transcript_19956/m.28266 type:complete len:230 (+) Transcript_19956:1208-1897(+)